MNRNLFQISSLIDLTECFKVKEEALNIVEKNIYFLDNAFPSSSTRKTVYSKISENIDWTSGFWSGILSLSYEFSHDVIFFEALKNIICSFFERLEDAGRLQTHDLGFIYVLSLIPWKKLSNETEKTVRGLIKAADKLILRFKKKPGFLQAWGKIDDPVESRRTIIDSMMNLSLLYGVWKITGKKIYKEIAEQHATTCMKYLVRNDYSTYHSYLFDIETGNPLKPETVQGYSDNSYWSRGQAWAMYGFTISYIYTNRKDFLNTAIGTSKFFLKNLPDDFIPYWDFVFKDGDSEEKDSSAAAIAICALLELSKYLDIEDSVVFEAAAYRILNSLILSYFNRNFSGIGATSILLHGVQHKPKKIGVDEGNIWGDYFFLEALMRVLNKRWIPYWFSF